MSETQQIQLLSGTTITAINLDAYENIDLSTHMREILPYDQTNVISQAQLFNQERQESQKYRIYGTLDFMSIVNGLTTGYTSVFDFFTRPRLGDEFNGLTRNFLNCFEVYLCKPLGNTFSATTFVSTGGTTGFYNTTIFGGSKYTRPYTTFSAVTTLESGNTLVTGLVYELKYEVLTNLNNFQIYKSGYAKNIFYDQNYSFNFNKDFDVSNFTDSFGKPLTNLYLFLNFNPHQNGIGQFETITENTSTDGIEFTGQTAISPHVVYSSGMTVNGDWSYYDPNNFEDFQVARKEYTISFYCTGTTGTNIQFKYNPFIPIKLRDFNDQIVTGNITGTSEIDKQIASYAVKLDDHGNYGWEDILPNGFIDPLSNRGVNYPFVNNRHYIFSNIVVRLATNLNDENTRTTFATIELGNSSLLYNKPTSNLNNLGNKC